MTPLQQAQRTRDDSASPDYWEKDYPPELDDAVPCVCGSLPFIPKCKEGESPKLRCGNARCGREVEATWVRLAEAVAAWNKEVKEESCQMHGSMLRDDGKFYCPHCDKLMS